MLAANNRRESANGKILGVPLELRTNQDSSAQSHSLDKGYKRGSGSVQITIHPDVGDAECILDGYSVLERGAVQLEIIFAFCARSG